MTKPTEATPRPWRAVPRNWRNEPEPFDWYISGNTTIDTSEDGDECECSTGIAIVKGNATSGDIAEKNAALIVKAVNRDALFDELVRALREFMQLNKSGGYEFDRSELAWFVKADELLSRIEAKEGGS